MKQQRRALTLGPGTAASLLQQIDPLPAPARDRTIAETARRMADTPALRELIDTLSEQGPYGARVAMRMAVVAEDRSHVERSLDSADPGARMLALAAAVRLGLPAGVLVERLPQLPVAHRTVLYRAVRDRSAEALAEALLPVARSRFGDREAAALLPALGPGLVAALLPDLDHAVVSWTALGRRHPEQLLAYVDARLSAEPTALWVTSWRQVGTAVAAALRTDPARVLDLLERSLPYAPFPAALLPHSGALARFDPARFLRLLTDPRRLGTVHVGRKTMKALAGLPDVDLVALGRSLDETGRLDALLHSLPPSRRAIVHHGVVGTRGLDRDELKGALRSVDELPAEARHAEARRLLTLRSVADDPRARLEVTARLDWASAEPPLRAATRRPEADDRSHAWACLVGAAARTREPAVLADLLGSMDRLRNDQDGVRCSVLSSLAAAPAWLFGDSDAPALGQLIVDAAEARDTSWATTSALRDLCDRLLREGLVHAKPVLVRCALDGFQLLASHASSPGLRGIARDLPRSGEDAVLEAMLPRIEADASRGEFGVALELADALGRRAWEMPRLQAFVDRARSAQSDHVVRSAISLWLAPANTRDERVALVLRADRSTITIPAVSEALARRRTDLLDEVFRRSMHGRFLKRGVRFVPQFHGCFHRWSPRQVAAYSRLLETVATSTGLPVWERTAATRSLGRAPGNLPILTTLTHDREVSVAEAAIAALAWTEDPPQVIPELVVLAQTDRERVAVHALTRAARFVRPNDLPDILHTLLVGAKVTSRKEAVRLLAEQRIPGAARVLAETFDLPGQHRDVRRAVVAAVRFHLDDHAAWSVLDLAVGDPSVASALLDAPASSVARALRPDYAALVQRVVESRDVDAARLALDALPRWLPWRPEAAVLLVDLVTDLGHSAVWRPALAALVRGCVLIDSATPLVAAASSLIAVDDPSLDGPDRDRPAHQRFVALVEETLAAVGGLHRTLATEVGEALVSLHVTSAIRLLAAGLDFNDATPILRICALADRATLAVLARRSVGQELVRVVRRLPGRAHELLSDLPSGVGSDPAVALVALGIVEAAGRVEGWSPDLQGAVRALREHDEPDVRDAALEVRVAPE